MTVRDSRNRRVPERYARNGRFYGQLWVDRNDGRKTARTFPLVTRDRAPVPTLNDSKEAMEVLRNDRRTLALPTCSEKPSFSDYVETYFGKPRPRIKSPAYSRTSAKLSTADAACTGLLLALPFAAAWVAR